MGTKQQPHWRQRFGKVFPAGRGKKKGQGSSRKGDPPRAKTAKAAAVDRRKEELEKELEEKKQAAIVEGRRADVEVSTPYGSVRKRGETPENARKG